MFKIIACWLFVMALIGDIVLIALRLFDVITMDWWVILSIPFAVAIVGTLAFAILYLLIKLFVSAVLGF